MKNSTSDTIKHILVNNVENILAALLSLIVTLVFLLKSPLHPWIGGESLVDSSVFKTIAMMMEKGYLPYKDTFDHKGPIIYFLNYIGNKISYYRGIWIIEVLFISFTIYVMYKTARLSCGKISSFISTLMAFSLLFGYFEGGNYTEEYAMPCIAIAIYYFLDYLKNNRLTKSGLFLAGAGLGIVLMLRPNMIAVWIVFCIYIFIQLLIAKNTKDLKTMAIFFTAGLTSILLPVLIWLAVNDDLSWFWDCYIVFNKLYSSAEGGRARLSTIWEALLRFINTPIFIVGFLSLFYHLGKAKQRKINIPYILFLIITVGLMIISGRNYGHYGMILVPAMVYPLSLLFECIESINQENIKKSLLMFVTLYTVSTIIAPGWFDILEDLPAAYRSRDERDIDTDEAMNRILSCIDQYTDPDQSISVYGNYDIIYVLSSRKHATRFSYQFPLGTVMPELMDEYFSQLQAELPNVIVTAKKHRDKRMTGFLETNNYHMVWCADPEDDQSIAVYAK